MSMLCSFAPRVERTLLSAGLLDLVRHAVPHEPVVGLEALHGLIAVVDERETRALATTVVCPETEDGDLVLAALVKLAELGPELVLGDVRARWVEDVTVKTSVLVFALPASHVADVSGNLEMLSLSDVSLGGYAHDHLLAAEQRVADKLARAQGHLAFRHDCGCRFDMSGSVSTVSARLAYFEVVDVRRVKFRCARANCQAMGFIFRLRQEFG